MCVCVCVCVTVCVFMCLSMPVDVNDKDQLLKIVNSAIGTKFVKKW